MAPRTGRPFPPVKGVEITHRFVDIGGLNVHVAEAGEGEPLLMLHGWPQNWWMWRNQIPLFAQKFRVIVPDMRGFGWTDAPGKGYMKERLAGDLIALVGALGLEHIRLLSHDWGGWIGYIVCATQPGLVTQHFATNIPPLWPRVSLHMIPALMRFGYMVRIAMPYFGPRLLMKNGDFVRNVLTRGGTHREGWSQDELSVFSEQFREPERARASAKLYRSFLCRELVPVGFLRRYRHQRITTPTRLLFGANDAALSLSWLRGYENHFDDFLIELVPRAGHFIVDERPELVSERAMKFFCEPRFNRHRPPLKVKQAE
jgi:pimeloyl-ACP methyl ester carboxylesterase